MHPLRIVILLVLLYILYRLLTSGSKKPKPVSPAGSGRLASHDVLVEDPVCHLYIPKGQALVLSHGGQARYFCSEQCREAFRAQQGENA